MMLRIIAALIAGLLLCAPAAAQMSPIPGFPPGIFQNRAALDAGSAPAYVGPGDVISGAKGWWGLRCYNAVYAGNVADVYAPSDASHTLITCSAGGTLNETVQALATTCATSCTVKTLYDQSGNAHDAIQASESLRPSLVLSCLGAKYCMAFVKASTQKLVASSVGATVQPWTLSAVTNRTGTVTSFQAPIGDVLNGYGMIFGNAANTVGTYANGILTEGGISDNAWHAVQAIGNGTSSVIDADGTSTTGDADLNGLSADMNIGYGLSYLDGRVAEAGLWASGFSGGNRTSMCHNQFAYWGTATSC